MNTLHRLWIWCKRFRHRCGYGVHSPSDFFLITFVIYEQLPYYAYTELRKRAFDAALPHYREKVNRLLFRLVNHFRPDTLLEVGTGNGAAFAYLQAARQRMKSATLEGNHREETLQKMSEALDGMQGIDCLHIGHTPYYKETFEAALPYVNERTCFLIGGIYDSKEKQTWWQQEVKTNEAVCITFDLYDLGLVFFDKNRIKQHYIVNFL